MKRSVLLYCGFFIIVLDLRLTKLVRACRETGFNFYRPLLFHTFLIDLLFYMTINPNFLPLQQKKMIKYFCLLLLILCSCNNGKKGE